MQEPTKNVSYTIRLGRQKKHPVLLTDQRSRRKGTGQINRPAEPAGVAILEHGQMSDILADYREWRDQQAARVSTHSAGCHMWHKDCMIHRLADALGRARLTGAERERVSVVADWASEHLGQDDPGVVALRALMERLK
jgi:hypothetical protein